MLNQQQTHSHSQVEDRFAEALATARKMQQDWLSYGLDFVHLYVEDVDGDWLETWGEDDTIGNNLLDEIKEFLVSDDDTAVKMRYYLGERSLFDLAVNLETSLHEPIPEDRLIAVRNVLAAFINCDSQELDHLAHQLIEKLL